MKIVEFYRGERGYSCADDIAMRERDHIPVRGDTLDEIMKWPDEWLEEDHDYIQWLFPSTEPSQMNSAAPTLTRDESYWQDAIFKPLWLRKSQNVTIQ